MSAQSYETIEALYTSWAARDLPATLACLADSIEFVIHVPVEVVPFAGETHGKDLIVPRLQMILDGFDFLQYRPLHIREDGDKFHAQVLYHFRHKQTGREIEGTMRHVGCIEGDKIVRLDEFHDGPRVAAYFELLARDASGAPQREFPNIARNR